LKLDTGIEPAVVTARGDRPEERGSKLTNDSHLNARTPARPQSSTPEGSVGQWRNVGLATLVLVLCFSVPFWDLAWFAAKSEFHSYILLMPFISLYLVWAKKGSFPICSPPARKAASVFLTAGTLVLIAYWLFLRSRLKLMEDDYLAVMMSSFLLFFVGICGLFLGREMLRATAFPLCLLVFMVPIPAFAMPTIDSFLQHGSAAVAQGFFTLSGTPFLRNGLVFQLPDIPIQVARECSGIQSSMVLLITGLVAGYLYLRRPWSRTLLALLMIPLGLVRNGFRVFTIGELCVHLGPQMINSPIHRKGGPLFFGLSLIPLFLLLILLRKGERAGGRSRLETGAIPNSQPPK
jgi:exosortase C (VPDSG-CTERM-specific)